MSVCNHMLSAVFNTTRIVIHRCWSICRIRCPNLSRSWRILAHLAGPGSGLSPRIPSKSIVGVGVLPLPQGGDEYQGAEPCKFPPAILSLSLLRKVLCLQGKLRVIIIFLFIESIKMTLFFYYATVHSSLHTLPYLMIC